MCHPRVLCSTEGKEKKKGVGGSFGKLKGFLWTKFVVKEKYVLWHLFKCDYKSYFDKEKLFLVEENFSRCYWKSNQSK